MSKRKFWLITYDISNPKRLSKALKIVTDYSCGGQRSCHEAWLSKNEATELETRLSKTLDSTDDKWVMFPIGFQPKTYLGGIASIISDHKSIFIGWQ